MVRRERRSRRRRRNRRCRTCGRAHLKLSGRAAEVHRGVPSAPLSSPNPVRARLNSPNSLSTVASSIHRSRIATPSSIASCDHGAMREEPKDATDNHVLLRGSLAVPPQTRILPSGDELCSFRLTVPRPKASHGRSRTDSIDCATTRTAAKRLVQRCSPGDRIEVSGSLRRRFWRSATGAPASRYEVEVIHIRRLRTAKLKGAAVG